MDNVKHLDVGGQGDTLPALGNTTTNAIIFDEAVFANVQRVAEVMAISGITVPKHLRGNVGDCMAIVMQSIAWGMNPWPVAQKTHEVNGVLGYEGQVVNAVITSMAPTKDRLNYEWYGPWENVIGNFVERTSQKGNKYTAPGWSLADEKGLGIRVWATIKGEQSPRVLDLLLSQAQPRNSTLWATDPKQQLAYLATKRWARLYCPDVILGVYTPDEISESDQPPRDITPQPAARTEIPAYPAEAFSRNFPTWETAIKSGKKSAAQIIATVETKGKLSDDQKRQVLDCEKPDDEPEQAGDPGNAEWLSDYDNADVAEGEQQ